MKRISTLLALVLCAILLLTACGAKSGNQSSSSSQMMNSSSSESSNTSTGSVEAPYAKFSATDLEGNAVDQSILEGHDLTVLNVWATFCGWCIKEMPALDEINEEYAEKGVQVIGVVMDVYNHDGSLSQEQLDLAKDLVEQTKVRYPQLLPSDDLLKAGLSEVSSIPISFFIDSKGNLVGEAHLGALEKDDWKALIDKRLSEVSK